ncbi:MAG TPA: Uma2 family endonuclease [Dehalococcoidia bacterium]|nr:Uma2 family endonuclease [Dehalococcoidia bacterium]
MPISFKTYERVALEDGDGHWELVCGHLQKKPPMTLPHNDAIDGLTSTLSRQLDRNSYRLRSEDALLRISPTNAFQPDLFVLPQSARLKKQAEHSSGLEMYDEPMPLVVEVWSPSTGDYDVNTKIPEYQRRGDAEIWLIHPYERWLRAWRRQADGRYRETLFRGEAVVEPVALPGVRVTLATLFE